MPYGNIKILAALWLINIVIVKTADADVKYAEVPKAITVENVRDMDEATAKKLWEFVNTPTVIGEEGYGDTVLVLTKNGKRLEEYTDAPRLKRPRAYIFTNLFTARTPLWGKRL